MNDCIFCKIIKGEIPCYKIYEDEDVLAFLDIAGDIDGHTLVIPKKHAKNILDCDSETLQKVMNIVKLVSEHYVSSCGYNGVNIMNANEECSGQSVFHLHFHIIPRTNGDNVDAFPHFDGAKHSLEVMQNKLKFKN